jgi:hypothetical protein
MTFELVANSSTIITGRGRYIGSSSINPSLIGLQAARPAAQVTRCLSAAPPYRAAACETGAAPAQVVQ